MPIMLALCLMLLHTYYAKNYAGIIDSGLIDVLLMFYQLIGASLNYRLVHISGNLLYSVCVHLIGCFP